MTVALAFRHFADEQVDITVIETGLGGRLDSTNVLKPELSIITNIGFDHQQFLGDTLIQIAKEKAGIIKRNAPVIVGKSQPKQTPFFCCKQMNSIQPPLCGGRIGTGMCRVYG